MKLIALVMIARNEARCIERSLHSARPHVDEMVVLDTGSSDATASLAAACGARVAHFEWVNDFSAARNVALSLTDAAWRLVMDADEWIAKGSDALAALRQSEENFIGQVIVNSEFDQSPEQIEHAPSWLSRVLPRGVVYRGRIHEQPDTSCKRVRLPLVLGHDGYRAQCMAVKAGRNAQLLKLALESEPHDPYLQYQMGKDLEVQCSFEAAYAWYKTALSAAPAIAPWRHDLVLRTLFTLKKLHRFELAWDLAQRELAQWTSSPDFFFTLGDLLLEWATNAPHLGHKLLPMIETHWLRAIEIGDKPDLPDSVCGRGSFLAAHNLAVMYESLGQLAAAQDWRTRGAGMRARAAMG